ncbi:response regulator [Sphingomonas lenta]|uniref:Response regulator n=1 Tax=Sphingomonas lenta TaxID=1141887 RepID=A0A2A2SIE1_9SPHN|nr:response regulator [Sphingomonas lenta]PAX08988.1 response regulator [Sphingomonas lenta]
MSARGPDNAPAILVVDDEPLVRFLAAEILEEDGFRVVEAGDAHEALAVLRTEAVPVHLVFSDIQMPGGLDGCDLARWVRENRPGLPVILTSGRIGDDALPGELRQLAPIVGKPYSFDHLTYCIRAALGR